MYRFLLYVFVSAFEFLWHTAVEKNIQTISIFSSGFIYISIQNQLNQIYNHLYAVIVEVLLDHDSELSKTVGQSNATPLISAATRGHLEVVNKLLSKDSSLLEISKSNGKNALHLAARQGHVGIVKALLDKDPQLARRTDKKGQTALHMAVKGVSCGVVKLLLGADAAIVMLPDKFGNTALHVATRKKRAEVLIRLFQVYSLSAYFLNCHRPTY